MQATQLSPCSQIWKKYIFLLFGISSSIFQIPANPVIAGYSGEITQGKQITITGKGFGTKPKAAPIKFDNFEKGKNGTPLYNIDSSWQEYNDGAKFSSATARSGSLSAGVDVPNGESFNTNYYILNTPSDEIFVSYWWRTINADSNDNTIVKLTRVCSSEKAGGGGVYNGAGNTTLGGTFDFASREGPYCAYDNGEVSETLLKRFASPPLNKWLKVEMYKKLGTPGTKNGAVECNLLGVDYAIDTAALTRARGYSFKLNTVLLGLMDGNAGSHSYQAFIDDIYIDNTRARIEIGNAATWSKCTIRETQLPITWADSSIKCSLNLGLFTPTEKLYLYIIDSNGRVNASGYPLFEVKTGIAPVKKNNYQDKFKISCKQNSNRTITLDVSLVKKGDINLSIIDLSGKELWNKSIYDVHKSESELPLPVKPFIVNIDYEQHSYSKLFFITK